MTRSPVQGLRGLGEGLAGCWRVPHYSLRVQDMHGEGACAGRTKRGSKAGRTVETEAGRAELEVSLGSVLKGERQKEGGLWVQVSKGGRRREEREPARRVKVFDAKLSVSRTHKEGGENGLP